MSRYTAWLAGAPLLVSFTATFIILTQALQGDRRDWIVIATCWAATFGATFVLFAINLRASMRELEQSRFAEASEPLSRLLSVSTTRANTALLAAAVLFTLFATLTAVRTVNGFIAFAVASFAASIFSSVFIYFIAKRLIVAEALRRGGAEYIGDEVSIARKIGLIFTGIFVATVATIVLLVTARVSSRLERLAIASATKPFEQIYAVAAGSTGPINPAQLKTFESYLDDRYSIYVIDPKSRSVVASTTGSPTKLSDEEVARISGIVNGNSSAFVAPNVSIFRQLKSGPILIMEIPFDHFQAIPNQITIYTGAVAGAAMLLFILVTYLISGDIARPLLKLRKVAQEMADGDFASDGRIFSDDEIGGLARSFAASRANLGRVLQRVNGSGSNVARGVRVMSGGTESLLSAAAEQNSLTRNSSEAVATVREGAESVLGSAEAVIAGATDTTSRAVELQASAEAVARSMDHLTESVEKISSSVLEMNASATETSSRTEVLAHIGQDVSTFVTEMDATVEELQRNANSTADISNDVRTNATAGSVAVKRSLEASQTATDATTRASRVIHELTGRIGQISQILLVIEEIAGRTNLLSLNAAIIAAQAGEQGAGFTVVADEIRELATRTRTSVTEISSIVRAIQQGSKQAATAIEEGVGRVTENLTTAQDASDALIRIENIAQRSYEMARRMAGALEQQATAARHLRDATSTMSDHIDQIHRSTQEQASSSTLLAAETERVRDIALQVKNSTQQQSTAARGITIAMSDVTSDMMTIRDLLESQLAQTAKIESASEKILTIAESNDTIAREFSETIDQLLESGRVFEAEVGRFRLV